MGAVVAQALERALAYAGGSHTLADLEAGIAAGNCQLWEGEDSAIVTELKQTPQQKILLFWLAAGNMTELRGMAMGINEWGRSLKCVKAQLIGRRGWERSPLVRFDGWKPISIVMEKAL